MASLKHLSRAAIKRSGAHYTPPELARFLAERGVFHLRQSREPVRVLDPACGDGSLLRAVAKAVAGQTFLIGYDTDGVALGHAGGSLAGETCRLEQLDFLATKSPPVDLIICNPPYVRTQVLGAKRSRELASRFGLRGRVDLYHAFVRAMAAALSDGGVLALLTSNRFMSIQSGAAMRELLRGEFDLREVYDLGDSRLFENAAVLPAIVIARKGAAGGSTTFCRVYQTDAGASRAFDDIFDAMRDGHAGVARVGSSCFDIRHGVLHTNGDASAPWTLESAQSRRWLQTVRAHTACTFGDVAKIRVGIKTTADNVFIRDDWHDLPPEQRPEDDLLRRLLTHHVATRWRIDQPIRTRVLYPHTIDSFGRRGAIDLADYPRAATYLEKHRAQLAGRKYVAAAGRAWYEIWVPQQPLDWAKPKIVYRDIVESPTFFLDTSGAIVNGDCYWITMRDGMDPHWLDLILAVANSRFIEHFYDAVFHNKLYARRRRFMTQYVRQFPLPPLDHPLSPQIIEVARAAVSGAVDVDTDALVYSAFGLPVPHAHDRRACAGG